MAKRIPLVSAFIVFLLLTTSAQIRAQRHITTPREQFGHEIGDDYFLVNYTQMAAYWKKLDQESDRVTIVDIGKTAEGRTMTMAIVTAAENQPKLAQYKSIAQRLAKAEGVTDAEARTLASNGKAVVWIDGGIHANEVLGAQQLIETVFQFASRTDAETTRILKDVIVLACIVNPDGMDLVSDWYMRQPDPSQRSLGGLPRLYEQYAGHDDNRDFYMTALPESRAVNRVLYRDWFPQIVYDHHQTGPVGTVMFSPPFRDPFNFNFDPLVMTMLDEVGSAMHSRFVAEDKPGVTTRSGANYSTWWNGGLRTSPYFHNMVGLLTETIGNPTPMEIPFAPSKQLPNADLPYPIAPQKWHFRQSIEYSITANRAVLDYAARNKDRLLFNIYRMGKNSIERGSHDTWTITPADLTAIDPGAVGARDRRDVPGGLGTATAPVAKYEQLRKPERRDPRGYIIPADQPDFLTAAKFVNTLIGNGISVQRAKTAFTVNGKTYPAGSFVAKTAQAFRPHILDMFEPQDHPNDFAYPGAPPTPPYDSAGWTLAYQMGVRFDRVLDGFDGPFEPVAEEIKPPAGTVTELAKSGRSETAPTGYLFTHEANDSFVAVNRLLRSGESVYWLTQPLALDGKTWPAGAQYVSATSSTLSKLQQLARDTGVSFTAVAQTPAVDGLKLRPPRIGLWDRYGGSVSSGWTRLVLEQFDFPYSVVYAPTLDGGNLADKFDVLIFADEALENGGAARTGVPDEYRDRVGAITTTRTVPQLKKFVEDGGVLLAIGRATNLAYRTGLPIADALTESQASGDDQPLASTKFYVPGSILQARVDPANPIAYGLDAHVDFFFDQSPAFRITGSAVHPVAWFDNDHPLRSGWAWGQSYLKDSVAVAEASLGKGRIVLYGPEILFRAQPHGTFKLLFNGIYLSHAERKSACCE
jgi:hypothetical protein